MTRTTWILVVVIALALVSAVFTERGVSPFAVGRYLMAEIGSTIGVNVAVPPNPFNTLAEQLKSKEVALAEKEQALTRQGAALESRAQAEERGERRTLGYAAAVGGVLLALISLNFYLDYRRRKTGSTPT